MTTSSHHNIPHVIHIGYSKCASTWLQHLFEKQTGIFFKRKTRFFGPRELSSISMGVEHYFSFFKNAQPNDIIIESDEHLILPGTHPSIKISTSNLNDIKELTDNLNKAIPTVKIIIIIRAQADMIASRYSEYIRWGGKLELNDFLKKIIYTDNYKKYADYRYSKVIEILQSKFKKDDVHIILQEELKKSPESVLNSLSKFLGYELKFSSETFKKTKNIGFTKFGLKAMRLLNILLVVEKNTWTIKTKTRGPYFIWLLFRLFIEKSDAIFFSKLKRHSLPIKDIENIKLIFRDDNKELEMLINKPLSMFNYY